MAQDFTLTDLFRAIDSKNRHHWDNLTDEQRKKHSNYLALRWASVVSADGDLAKYYLLSTNQNANKHLWSLNQHPKLQWLMTTCVSPGMGTHKREWVAMKNTKTKNPKLKILAELNPSLKDDELAVLDKITTEQELVDDLKNLGWTDQAIKAALKGKNNDH